MKKSRHVCRKRELNHFKAGFARGHVEALQAYRSHQSNARKSTSSPKSELFLFVGTTAVSWTGSHRHERPLMRAGLVSPWVVVSIWRGVDEGTKFEWARQHPRLRLNAIRQPHARRAIALTNRNPMRSYRILAAISLKSAQCACLAERVGREGRSQRCITARPA